MVVAQFEKFVIPKRSFIARGICFCPAHSRFLTGKERRFGMTRCNVSQTAPRREPCQVRSDSSPHDMGESSSGNHGNSRCDWIATGELPRCLLRPLPRHSVMGRIGEDYEKVAQGIR